MIPDSLWLDILGNVPIVCADCAIVRGGKALLILRGDQPAKGEWWVPGGRVLKGETLRQAARRKAMGEVGLDCWVGPPVHYAETIFDDGPGGVPVHSVNTCFLLWPKGQGQEVLLDPSIVKSCWVESAGELLLHPYVTACLRGAGL